jgi:lycopene cyclase domain-containing protein
MQRQADQAAGHECNEHGEHTEPVCSPDADKVDVSYSQFLALFLGLPILFFVGILRVRLQLSILVLLGVLSIVALVYTAPWDNLLVASGVWTYCHDHVSGLVIGRVPAEEYAFYVLQVFATGLWVYWLTRRIRN